MIPISLLLCRLSENSKNIMSIKRETEELMPWILPDPDEEPNMKNSEKIDGRKVFCDLKIYFFATDIESYRYFQSCFLILKSTGNATYH